MRMVQNKYRYPGVKPFETSEQELFFGRDRDIEDLVDLIWLEKLIVLFGKSGYGKSSLINAGIIPTIKAEIVPIIVRFGNYSIDSIQNPLELLKQKIDETLTDNPQTEFIQKLSPGDSLWKRLKTKQNENQKRFILIFDQFEEFFTYPISEQNAFKEQLSELLYTEVPQHIRNQIENINKEEQVIIAKPFDVKVLMVIRSDRMSLLDTMKDKLPAILQKRFELKGLSRDQAKEAILRPAKANGVFISPPFSYSEDALRVIIDKLSETKVSQRAGIEAFQLQILCEYMESEIIANKIPNLQIENQHFINKIDDIYEGYYQRLIDKLEPSVQKAAEVLIEEGLIYEDEKTGESRRLSVDADVLIQKFSQNGITHEVLSELENQFLLRREATYMGGYNYEVSHDTLLAPILRSKAERKALEASEKNRQENRKRQIRLLLMIVIILIAFATMTGIGIYIIDQKRKADFAREEAIKARNEAIAAKERAEKLAKELIIKELEKNLKTVETVLEGKGNCPDHITRSQILNLVKQFPDDEGVRKIFNKINSSLIKAKCKNL